MTPDELKAYRHSRTLSQADLALAVGVSRTFIIDLEKGRHAPSRIFLLALAAHDQGLGPYAGVARELATFVERRPRRVRRPKPEA